MIQVLQCVDRLGTEIAKSNSENLGQAHLQKRLDAEKKKSESLQRQLSLSDAEKHNLKEQLVAANTELYVYKRIHEEAPKANTEVILRKLDQNRVNQHDTLVLLENKLSTIFDVVNDMRHLSGDRTETEDSPQKRNSMFPDESDDAQSPPSQPHMYPERVVVDLKEELRAANATIEELKEELKTKEIKLRRAERHSERIRQLSLAWQHDDEAANAP
uniref:Uncharacterized protein n=1 Tax=Globisporangium ultimum (strain ATCC 200006 / CBS 805.95 / DAOM BR144) TaxID=431595 RepID=K3WIN1_GLOUD